jgi:hypothetical protein
MTKDDNDNVIPFPVASKDVLIPCSGVIGSDRVHPELVWDPTTDRYSIICENVEVYSGLDPVGKREKMRRPLSVAPAPPSGVEPAVKP